MNIYDYGHWVVLQNRNSTSKHYFKDITEKEIDDFSTKSKPQDRIFVSYWKYNTPIEYKLWPKELKLFIKKYSDLQYTFNAVILIK